MLDIDVVNRVSLRHYGEVIRGFVLVSSDVREVVFGTFFGLILNRCADFGGHGWHCSSGMVFGLQIENKLRRNWVPYSTHAKIDIQNSEDGSKLACSTLFWEGICCVTPKFLLQTGVICSVGG